MSERSRNEKLTSAKKKLKKFQQTHKMKKENITPEDSSPHSKLRFGYFLNYNYCGVSPLINIVNQMSNVVETKPPPNDNQSYKKPLIDNLNGNNDELYNDMEENVKENFDGVFNMDNSLREPNATTENIKQISRQLNGIISCSNSSVDRESQIDLTSTIRDLEKRNVELATLNSQKLEQIEMLNSKLKSVTNWSDTMKSDFNKEKDGIEQLYKRQSESQKNQLQAQVHTISLLVAEKSELQSQVTHNQKMVAQKCQELEDFTTKLKSSRQKVGELEKSLSDFKLSLDRSNDARRDMTRQLDQLRSTNSKLKLERDDLISECSQYKSKLLAKSQEAANMELSHDQVHSQLEMYKVQLQQLTNNQGQYDDFYSKLQVSEQKVQDLTLEIQKLQQELSNSQLQNENTQKQYKTYFGQMEDKIHNLEHELKRTKSEKEQIHMEWNIIDKKYKELQSQIDDKKNDGSLITSEKQSQYNSEIHQLTQERSQLQLHIDDLQSKIEELSQELQSQTYNNNRLSQLNMELQENNYKLTERNNEYEVSKQNYSMLLEQVQSDKTALSRSLSQNKQLKTQLIELQEAFVKLSSDNMELSTSLQHEQHVNKELAARFGDQEEELNELRTSLNTKDAEISKMNQTQYQLREEILASRNSTSEERELDNHQIKSSTHNNDSVYNNGESDDVVIKKLEAELINAQGRVNHLINENESLKDQIKNRATESDNKDESAILKLNLRQLEAERNELLRTCEGMEKRLKETNEPRTLNASTNKSNDLDIVSNGNGHQDTDLKMQYLKLQSDNEDCVKALGKLEKELANQQQYTTQLEHIIDQLEGETDTIGEYITLYQSQRAKLKQRNQIKEELFVKLNHQNKLIDVQIKQLEAQLNQLTDVISTKTHNGSEQVASVEQEIISNCLMYLSNLKHSNHFYCENTSTHTNLHHSTTVQSLPQSPCHKDPSVGTQSCPITPKSHCNNSTIMSLTNQHDYDNELNDYRIIHCKCCTGKIIDL